MSTAVSGYGVVTAKINRTTGVTTTGLVDGSSQSYDLDISAAAGKSINLAVGAVGNTSMRVYSGTVAVTPSVLMSVGTLSGTSATVTSITSTTVAASTLSMAGVSSSLVNAGTSSLNVALISSATIANLTLTGGSITNATLSSGTVTSLGVASLSAASATLTAATITTSNVATEVVDTISATLATLSTASIALATVATAVVATGSITSASISLGTIQQLNVTTSAQVALATITNVVVSGAGSLAVATIGTSASIALATIANASITGNLTTVGLTATNGTITGSATIGIASIGTGIVSALTAQVGTISGSASIGTATIGTGHVTGNLVVSGNLEVLGHHIVASTVETVVEDYAMEFGLANSVQGAAISNISGTSITFSATLQPNVTAPLATNDYVVVRNAKNSAGDTARTNFDQKVFQVSSLSYTASTGALTFVLTVASAAGLTTGDLADIAKVSSESSLAASSGASMRWYAKPSAASGTSADLITTGFTYTDANTWTFATNEGTTAEHTVLKLQQNSGRQSGLNIGSYNAVREQAVACKYSKASVTDAEGLFVYRGGDSAAGDGDWRFVVDSSNNLLMQYYSGGTGWVTKNSVSI